MNSDDKFRGCLLGLAVGDAVGTTVEFRPRGTFQPLTDMIGGGPFHLKAGQWTDDTAMALCLATSLVECGEFNARDQMERYCLWKEEGYLSGVGRCFDIGNTTASALRRFRQTDQPYSGPTHAKSAGNGCIMRLAPIPIFFFPDTDAAGWFAADSSRTTHGTEECLGASRLMARMLVRALAGGSREDIALADGPSFVDWSSLADIAKGVYLNKSEAEIRGSGYVIQSLEAALWCFMRTGNFRDAILAAANLGDDADTTAAICGQIAGAYYGESGIPPDWLNKLVMGQEIRNLADRLRHQRPASAAIHQTLRRNQAIRVNQGALFGMKVEPKPVDFDFDRVEGMLLGLAVGDALGNACESQSPAKRRSIHGEIRDYLPNRHADNRAIGLPSDDTQLAFWMLEQLILDQGFVPEKVAQRFAQRGQIFGLGSAVRGFLGNLREGLAWHEAGTQSAGNGALMVTRKK
ncbi:MAG: ADP-ribosylglycohydrolase family protein [Pseudomonadota bacterium]